MMTSDTERIEREMMARWYADGAAVSLRRLFARIAAAEAEVAILRIAYDSLTDEAGYDPVCDAYDPAGPGAIDATGEPQCARCGHPRVVHRDVQAVVGGRVAVGPAPG